jgi:ABC-type glycerol-3-phosphate transport system substrate-binding protein
MKNGKLLGLVILMTMIALGGAWAAPVTVEFWTFDDWGRGVAGDLFHTFVAEFEKANPDIKINFVAKPGNDIQSGLVTGASSGTLPDAYTMGFNAGDALVRAQVPEDVSKYFNALPAAYKGQFAKPAMDALTSGKAVYGVPFTSYAIILYRNLNVLKKAGIDPNAGIKDWADWTAQMKKIKAAGFQAMPDFRGEEQLIEGMLGGMGVKNGVADGKTTVKESEVKAVLDAIQPMIPYMSEIDNWDQGSSDMFKQDKLAFIFSGPWGNPDFEALSKSNPGFKYDFVNIPGKTTSQVSGVYGGEWFGVGKGSKNAAQAFKFISYLADSPQAARFAAQLGRTVQNTVAMKDKQAAANRLNQVVYKTATMGFQDSAWFQFWPIDARQDFAHAVGNIAKGMSTSDAAKQCIADLNKTLANK